jgi:hypothetical protein
VTRERRSIEPYGGVDQDRRAGAFDGFVDSEFVMKRDIEISVVANREDRRHS